MSAALFFRRTFSQKNLRSIYQTKIRESHATGLDRITPEALKNKIVEECKLINEKVAGGTYRFTPYKEKLISKGANSSPRVISIPTARDRITLRALSLLLSQVFPEAITQIPQVKIDSLSKELLSGKYDEFVKIDLKSFYPSISHDLLLKKIRSKIRKPQIVDLLEKAIKTPTVSEKRGGRNATPTAKGVPQGLSISNILAEIFLLDFDQKIAGLKGIFYARYVDDILILCPKGKAKRLAEEICSLLRRLQLDPHDIDAPGSKTKWGNLGADFEFLGYSVRGSVLGVRKENVHKFEGSLAGICTAYRHRLKSARNLEDKKRAVDVSARVKLLVASVMQPMAEYVRGERPQRRPNRVPG